MSKKKILFLGGAFSQLPAIIYAKTVGCYVITLDYMPSNPGHNLSDEYYNISTIDQDKVLELALKKKIDAISAYASDPSALTAAYVSEKMGLIGGSFQAVEILSDKSLFRRFLQLQKFAVPSFAFGRALDDFNLKYLKMPAIMKPVDASGSKGVCLVRNVKEISSNFNESLKYSRNQTVILEELIERKGPQIHGEGYVEDGVLKFVVLGDQYFSPHSLMTPYSTVVPSIFHKDIMETCEKLVQALITRVGFQTGGINIEIIRDVHDKLYILEIGARNGGNFMPQLIKLATNLDLVTANINGLLGRNVVLSADVTEHSYFAQVILHSNYNGRFVKVQVPEIFKEHVLENHLYYKSGDYVKAYRNSSDVIGVLILDISGKVNEYLDMLKTNDWVKVERL